MAKINVEIDTESKNVKIIKDNSELNPDSFSISTYACQDVNGKPYTCVCASYSMQEADGMRTNRSVHFDTTSDGSVDEDGDEYNMASEVTKIHKRIKASKTIAKALKDKNNKK